MCVQGAEPGPPLAVCCWGLAWGAVSLISRKGLNSGQYHFAQLWAMAPMSPWGIGVQPGGSPTKLGL